MGLSCSGGQGRSGVELQGPSWGLLRKEPEPIRPLYRFSGAADGARFPAARLLIGADGSLYGSTSAGGDTRTASLDKDAARFSI